MMIYPLVKVNKKLLTMAIEIIDLPINSMVILHSYVSVYQRVTKDRIYVAPEMVIFT